jgi:hypothetical protein
MRSIPSKLQLASVFFALSALTAANFARAQKPAAPTHTQAFTTAELHPAAPASDRDVRPTQQELIKLLRLTPTLTTVVAHDPSLLANTEYVNRNNPELGQFLALHPEVVRNPDFYLFTHMSPEDGSPDQALQRAVWPEYSQTRPDRERVSDILGPFMALCAFACFMGALIWMTKMFIENRRWNRTFKLQSDVHSRLIDKFSSTQELAHYMETEAGRRFLEAAPISLSVEPGQRMPNAVARVLTPLQIGIVSSLLGAGLLAIRRSRHEMEIPFLILGTLALMPGLGFILSAGLSWILAHRLGLMPIPQQPEMNPSSHPQISNEQR